MHHLRSTCGIRDRGPVCRQFVLMSLMALRTRSGSSRSCPRCVVKLRQSLISSLCDFIVSTFVWICDRARMHDRHGYHRGEVRSLRHTRSIESSCPMTTAHVTCVWKGAYMPAKGSPIHVTLRPPGRPMTIGPMAYLADNADSVIGHDGPNPGYVTGSLSILGPMLPPTPHP